MTTLLLYGARYCYMGHIGVLMHADDCCPCLICTRTTRHVKPFMLVLHSAEILSSMYARVTTWLLGQMLVCNDVKSVRSVQEGVCSTMVLLPKRAPVPNIWGWIYMRDQSFHAVSMASWSHSISIGLQMNSWCTCTMYLGYHSALLCGESKS